MLSVLQFLSKISCTRSFLKYCLHLQALNDTTKARDGYQRMPLMDGIGVPQHFPKVPEPKPIDF